MAQIFFCSNAIRKNNPFLDRNAFKANSHSQIVMSMDEFEEQGALSMVVLESIQELLSRMNEHHREGEVYYMSNRFYELVEVEGPAMSSCDMSPEPYSDARGFVGEVLRDNEYGSHFFPVSGDVIDMFRRDETIRGYGIEELFSVSIGDMEFGVFGKQRYD
jgi:hypothetical protein